MDYMKRLESLSLGSRLKRLSDHLFSEVTIIYESVGLNLNPSYFLLINLINKRGAMGITQAAEALSISHPAVSKLANKMISEGYLIKSPHPTDKRASSLSLTTKSLEIIKQAEPTWKVIKEKLDYIESLQTTPLITALDEFESTLKNNQLAENVLKELNKTVNALEIVNWNDKYKGDFKALNMSWLNNEFNGILTKDDKQSLDHPESYYLATGGYIFFAIQDKQVIGCIAIKPVGKNYFEFSKMAVIDNQQGQGIGRKLLLTALDKVRDLQIKNVFLETNSKLTRAMKLYQNVGFKIKPHPDGKSKYQRADTYMELQLHV